jgi:hypothetical protein
VRHRRARSAARRGAKHQSDHRRHFRTILNHNRAQVARECPESARLLLLARRGTSREINRQVALNLVRAQQPILRADLARRSPHEGQRTVIPLTDIVAGVDLGGMAINYTFADVGGVLDRRFV